MKYIKLIEDKKEDDDIIDEFEMCFQELIDKGFKVEIYQSKRYQIDFNDAPIVGVFGAKCLDKIPCFVISISKYSKLFNIEDIKDELLTVESYMKQEFKLNIMSLFINKYYYKSIDYLPVDKDIKNINICFTKN